MRHDWIFDVLIDLRKYALKNRLPNLAAQVDAALRVARDEIAAVEAGGDGGDDPDDEGPPRGRPN